MGQGRSGADRNQEAFVRESQQRRSDKIAGETIEGPAKIHAGHSQGALGPQAGARKGWRNDAEHPLSLALAKGQLIRGKECHTPRMRFGAGDLYRMVYEAACPRGRDDGCRRVALANR
jgi:hypothetical protein